MVGGTGGEGHREHVLQFLQICRQNVPLHFTEVPQSCPLVFFERGPLYAIAPSPLFEFTSFPSLNCTPASIVINLSFFLSSVADDTI